jgi:biopolymer transport protein ExbD
MSMRVGKKGYQSDINITPYIDILLVLLIIFMTTAPMKKYDHPIRPPQPATELKERKTTADSIIVDMDANRSITLNMQPITLEKLGTTLTEIFSRRAAKEVFIRGDSSIPYGDIFPLLDIARRSGANDIALLSKKSNLPSNNTQALR